MNRKTPNLKRQCPICPESFGQDRSLLRHLREAHDVEEELEDVFIEHALNGVPPTCRCGCGTRLPFRGWTKGFAEFIKGHNANVYSAYDQETARDIIETRRAKLRGRRGWSAGLTKETSPALAKAARTRSKTVKDQFDSGRRVAWNRGLTKDIDPRVKQNGLSLQRAHAEGRAAAWHGGLSGDCDERIRSKNEALRAAYANGTHIPWNKGLTKETSPALAEAYSKRSWDGFQSRPRFTDEEVLQQLAQCTRTKFIGSISEYVNANARTLRMKCNDCGAVTLQSLATSRTDACPHCHRYISKGEAELADFINSLGVAHFRNDRNAIAPHELDVYLPDHALAIEYNGLYFHSEIFKSDRNYHANKTQACSLKGIQLLHVWEDQWLDRRHIIENKIRYHLGLHEHRIGARRCRIIKVPRKQRQDFFNDNHVDGDVPSKLAIGLETPDGLLVSCMSFRRPFHKKWSGRWEVARFANREGWVVPGALARLSRAALIHASDAGAQGLMTYVDGAWGTGGGYRSAGWQTVDVTSPTFWWTDGAHRVNRFRYRADKKRGLSEAQIAEEAGVVRIWGCKQFVLTIDT